MISAMLWLKQGRTDRGGKTEWHWMVFYLFLSNSALFVYQIWKGPATQGALFQLCRRPCHILTEAEYRGKRLWKAQEHVCSFRCPWCSPSKVFSWKIRYTTIILWTVVERTIKQYTASTECFFLSVGKTTRTYRSQRKPDKADAKRCESSHITSLLTWMPPQLKGSSWEGEIIYFLFLNKLTFIQKKEQQNLSYRILAHPSENQYPSHLPHMLLLLVESLMNSP